ncbi:MAG: hypothetical protein ABI969_00990, partial [bacterium]
MWVSPPPDAVPARIPAVRHAAALVVTKRLLAAISNAIVCVMLHALSHTDAPERPGHFAEPGALVRCYVADGDWIARHLVCDSIARVTGAMVVGSSSDVWAVLRDVELLRPDALFVDARMNAHMLTTLLSLNSTNECCVVLVSGLAADAELPVAREATDFVLRPCSRTRIADAIERVRHQMRERA